MVNPYYGYRLTRRRGAKRATPHFIMITKIVLEIVLEIVANMVDYQDGYARVDY